ncbi:MAG: AAA family ATPase, partial [Terriglobales bacterium]
MALKFSFIANEESARQSLEAALRATGRATLAGRGLSLPQALLLSDPQIKQLQAQAPEAVIIDTPEDRPETALDLVSWVRSQMPLATIIVVGPMEPPQRIVLAMRAGANEYLEQPLRAAALEEALTHCAATRSPDQRPGNRGKLFAVLGARGGCGATTVAVNLALSLHSQRRESDPAVVLLDAAPLGHAALHLNLKPQFTLADLLAHAQRLDAAMLTSLMQRHASGLELLAGPSAPLP